VENRPGASGTLGAEIVAKAPADGYTLMLGTTGTLASAPSLIPSPARLNCRYASAICAVFIASILICSVRSAL